MEKESGVSGRHAYADKIGMSRRTSDNIISKIKNLGKYYLTDNPKDAKTQVKISEVKQRHMEVIQTALGEQQNLPLQQLKKLVNDDILKSILKEEGILKDDDQRLWITEPLDPEFSETQLNNPEVAAKFNKQKVKSHNTVSNWLRDFHFTKKNVVIDKENFNVENNKQNRLEYAKKLESILDDPDALCLFQTELEFYLNNAGSTVKMKEKLRKAKKGKGKKKKGKGKIAKRLTSDEYRFTVSMTADSTEGLFHTEVYPCDKGGKRYYKGTFTDKRFKEYMNDVLEKINEKVREKTIGDKKAIYIIIDGSSEHVADINVSKFLQDLPSYDEALYESNDLDLELILTAPNCPQLNFAEYFANILRSTVNTERWSLIKTRELAQSRRNKKKRKRKSTKEGEEEVKTPKKKPVRKNLNMKNRVSGMTKIVRNQVDSLNIQSGETTGFLTRLQDNIDDVIKNDGYIEYNRPL